MKRFIFILLIITTSCVSNDKPDFKFERTVELTILENGFELATDSINKNTVIKFSRNLDSELFSIKPEGKIFSLPAYDSAFKHFELKYNNHCIVYNGDLLPLELPLLLNDTVKNWYFNINTKLSDSSKFEKTLGLYTDKELTAGVTIQIPKALK